MADAFWTAFFSRTPYLFPNGAMQSGIGSRDRRLRLSNVRAQNLKSTRSATAVRRSVCFWGRQDTAMIEILFIYQLARNPVQAFARRLFCRGLFLATKGRHGCPENRDRD
jgi:hypothetical protein